MNANAVLLIAAVIAVGLILYVVTILSDAARSLRRIERQDRGDKRPD